MPRIFDNIDNDLLDPLTETVQHAYRAEFCVGFFNLRGWRSIDQYIDNWPGGDSNCCRLLVSMQNLHHEELRRARSLASAEDQIDNQAALRVKNRLTEGFREQFTFGAHSNRHETSLTDYRIHFEFGNALLNFQTACIVRRSERIDSRSKTLRETRQPTRESKKTNSRFEGPSQGLAR